MTTPMMKQYLAAKRKAPEAVLLFRMGDFFEVFFDDAKLVSRELGLALTSRSKGEGAVPMAGFPHRSVSMYLRKLLENGHKVAICEQVEDPKDAKGLVDRDVVRIVTPGTLTEDEVLSPKDENHLAAVDAGRDAAGIAWVDLSTGRFQVEACPPAALADEISRIRPSETLISEALSGPGRAELESALGRRKCMFTPRPSWSFDREGALAGMKARFGVAALDGFGLSESAPYIGPAGALLGYLEETQKTALGHITRVTVYSRTGHMVLDGPTRRSLELVESPSGGREGTLLSVLDSTRTAMGGRLLKEWVLNPLLDMGEIGIRQEAVAELCANARMRSDLQAAAGEIHDVERISARIACGRAMPRDLVSLGASLARIPSLKAALDGAASKALSEIRGMEDFKGLAELLSRALCDSPPQALKEGGIIRRGYDAELDALLDVAREGKGWIARFQAEEAHRTGIPSLKIGYNRVFGYYIEVTNVHSGRVPSDYVRKQTLKNAERYVTDQLKEHEARVLSADEKSKELEYGIFLRIRDECASFVPALQAAAAAVARADALLSLAQAACAGGWARPGLADGGVIDIRDGRHPVLESVMGPGRFVPNDLVLGAGTSIIVITGPNMAGKSTYIRQAALLVLMAQIGSFIPASRASIGIADRIFTRIGASDELQRGLSTFMVEMNETANILNNATGKSLVILDEVGRGTSTFDGVSIAWAVTEHLACVTGARTLFATHYHELTGLALVHKEVRNFHVSVKEWGEKLVFVHKIAEGGVDQSYGIHVARLAGLPGSVIDKARDVLDRLEGQAVTENLRPSLAPDYDSPAVQLTLFSRPPSKVLDEIRKLDVDGLTPVEALVKLSLLRKAALREEEE